MEQLRDGVDHDRDRSLVAGNSARDVQLQRRTAYDLNCVVRIGGIEVHREVKLYLDLVPYEAFDALVQTAGQALLHAYIGSCDIAFGDNRFAGLAHAAERPPKRVR